MTGLIPNGISMALDSEGHPYIVYQSADNAIKIARPAPAAGELIGNCGPASPFYTWQCDTLRLGVFGATMGDYVSIAFNPAGVPTIAYYGGSTSNPGNLYIAYRYPHRVFLPMSLEN